MGGFLLGYVLMEEVVDVCFLLSRSLGAAKSGKAAKQVKKSCAQLLMANMAGKKSATMMMVINIGIINTTPEQYLH